MRVMKWVFTILTVLTTPCGNCLGYQRQAQGGTFSTGTSLSWGRHCINVCCMEGDLFPVLHRLTVVAIPSEQSKLVLVGIDYDQLKQEILPYFVMKWTNERRCTHGQWTRGKCSTTFTVREMQIKTIKRYYYLSIGVTIIKKTITSFNKNMKNKEHCWRERKTVLPLGKTVW